MLPVLRPVGGEEEVNAIRETIESGWWGKGPKVAQFEKEFAIHLVQVQKVMLLFGHSKQLKQCLVVMVA